MNFLSPWLLAGTSLVVVPIVLHLVMRQKPRLMEFPALRLMQKSHEANRRRLRLRHLLLLLLRAGVIALLAFAMARPTIKFGGSWGSTETPVAAALVFDTSSRMDYRHANQTRLDVARRIALDLLTRLPRGSQLAVLDTRGGDPRFQVDRSAAAYRIERLTTSPSGRPLAEVVLQAIRLLDTAELAQREVYVLTDLAEPAWPEVRRAELARVASDADGTSCYLVDVGVPEAVNSSLGETNLSRQLLAAGNDLIVSGRLTQTGRDATRTVELHLLNENREPEKRAERTVTVSAGQTHPLTFRLKALSTGTHQGYLEIVGGDALSVDDRRYFTVEVTPPWPVLIAAPRPATKHAMFVAEALAPESFRRRGQARFDVKTVELGALAEEDLQRYAAVWVLDPGGITPAVSRKLTSFAASGRGVAISLGPGGAEGFEVLNSATAQSLLPGRLVRQAQAPDGDLYLVSGETSHPVLESFRSLGMDVPWEAFPVFRYWQLGAMEKGTRPIIHYRDGEPAVLDRVVGRGRVLTFTTPLSITSARQPWNVLPTGWPFLVLVNFTTDYLVGRSEDRLNYEVDQTAVLKLDPATKYSAYVMSLVQGDRTIDVGLTPDLDRSQLLVSATQSVGNYRIRAGGETSGVDRGISVNLAPGTTVLDRVDPEELTAILSPLEARVARDAGQLERNVAAGRSDRDLFPLVAVLVVLLLAGEYVVANRFYRKEGVEQT